MSYFTTVLCETADSYKVVDIDVNDAAGLDDLTDMMAQAGDGYGDALAVIEHEDEWFALVRLMASDEVKVFLSDVAAISESPYAEIFSDYLDAPADDEYEEEDFADDDEIEDNEEPEDEQDDELEMLDLSPDTEWSGDPDIFADRGIGPDELIEQVENYGSDPARVVAHVGETVGFADQLEAAR